MRSRTAAARGDFLQVKNPTLARSLAIDVSFTFVLVQQANKTLTARNRTMPKNEGIPRGRGGF